MGLKNKLMQDNVAFTIKYDGKPAPSFGTKIKTFIDRILPYAPYLKQYSLAIDTSNSFPTVVELLRLRLPLLR
ncbi:MAG: hypothetical protein CM15mP83_4560 [Flavobacteriaceae bacterium]|nr:MAG: hypothetical protein CM15mP83_4560 [Flavobacteriaceae bacterium]